MYLPCLSLTRTATMILSWTSQVWSAKFTIPQGNGPYGVSLTVSELIDHSRLDPFNSSHVRRLMVSRFSPMPKDRCTETEKVPYMSNLVAAVEDEIFAAYDFPKGFWSQFELEFCTKDLRSPSNQHDSEPFAIFGPGLNSSRLFYSAFAQNIASYGIQVLTVDHPYDVDVVEFPNGDVIYAGPIVPPQRLNDSWDSIVHAQSVRADDMSFILDHEGITSDTEPKPIVFGHSFGGSASTTSLLRDLRFRGGLNLDGTIFETNYTNGLGTPEYPQTFLLFGQQGHNSFTDSTWARFWSALEASPNVDFKADIGINGTKHGSFDDIGLLVDVAGVRGNLTEKQMGQTGAILGTRMREILGRYVPAFFETILGIEDNSDMFYDVPEDLDEVYITRPPG